MSEISRKQLNADGSITVKDYGEILGDIIEDAWLTWTPTITWTGGTPTDITTRAFYKKVGKTVLFSVRITATDGGGANGWQIISLPFIPKVNSVMPVCYALQIVYQTYSARYAYVKDDAADGYLRLSTGTLTAASSMGLWVAGEYEID